MQIDPDKKINDLKKRLHELRDELNSDLRNAEDENNRFEYAYEDKEGRDPLKLSLDDLPYGEEERKLEQDIEELDDMIKSLDHITQDTDTSEEDRITIFNAAEDLYNDLKDSL